MSDTMKYRILTISLLAFSLVGCKSLLEENVYSQLDPSKMFSTQTGIERVLFNAYDYAAINGNFGGNIQFQEEWVCDQFWETGGAVNQQYVPMSNFSFDAGYPTHWANLWTRMYKAIRDCNLVLENIDGAPIDDATKATLKAEARFVRASAYFKCYSLWGPVPLRKGSLDDANTPRCTAEEIESFIETEFTEALKDLPEKGTKGYQYGRATKGAAQAYLCKHYLQHHQWQKAVDMADAIINSGKYELWSDYCTLFTVDNEMTNNEYIWVYTCISTGTGNEMMNGAFPAKFKSTVDGKIQFLSNMRNWARMDRIWDDFYNTYDPADKRLGLYCTEYIDADGKHIDLKNANNIRLFKYTPDVNAEGNAHGNDIPVIRLADIILAKAEALNELNGPTQEALDLVQQIRTRAGLTEPLKLSDYDKDNLRDRIIQERSWELVGENHRREDLLRVGKFVEVAKARALKQYGETVANKVDDHFKVFPIPYNEADANTSEGFYQNPGY